MKPNELGRWLRDEHEKVNELSARLRDQIAGVPRSRGQAWIDELRERFEHLRAHLVKHMALEEHDGYMDAVLELRPTLSDEVDRLRKEHDELRRLQDMIHASLAVLQPGERLLTRDAGRRIEDFLSYVEGHAHHENVLVLAVFTDDIGTNG